MSDASNNLLSTVMPQFFPAHWREDAPDIVFTQFPSRIRIGYVLRTESSYSYIMRPTLKEMGVSLESLHEAALRNLDDSAEIQLTVGETLGGPEAFLKETADNFRAVRILLPRVQDALVDELGDEYFVSIPGRDWFICWSKNQSAEWQQRNIANALSDFTEDDYNLTPDILLRSSTGFSVHFEQ